MDNAHSTERIRLCGVVSVQEVPSAIINIPSAIINIPSAIINIPRRQFFSVVARNNYFLLLHETTIFCCYMNWYDYS